MTRPGVPFTADHGREVVVRGITWGIAAGAISGALSVAPLVGWNGPWEALLIYPPMAAVPGAVIGAVVGLVAGAVLAAGGPKTQADARGVAALVGALCMVWVVFLVPLFGLWVIVLAAASGAAVGPRVSARPSGAAAAGGRASPGSSPAPGR